MHQDLHLFPYKIQILQLQTDANRAERRAVGQTTSQRITDYPGVLNFIFFSDEANSHLDSHVNKQTVRFSFQPHEHQYHPLSVEKVTVDVR